MMNIVQPLAVVWRANPEILDLGFLAIRWYGLLFALGFVTGYFIMEYMFKKEGVPAKELDRLTTWVVIGAVLGARLGHVFFYEPAWYLANPAHILMIWEGGLASHGGAVGVLLALWYFSRKSVKSSFLWIFDRISIAVALAGVFIRMGNLMNSEIYGEATTLPWGFVFALNGETVPKHPTQIYEALGYLLIAIALFAIYRQKQFNPRPGLLAGVFLISLFGIRFLIEFVKQPQVEFETSMMLNMGQLLSIPFVIWGLLLLWKSTWFGK